MSPADAQHDSLVPPRSAPRRTSLEAFSLRPSQLTGTVLGQRYKICGSLSRSASARLYLAEDLESAGAVVIKVLSPETSKDSELCERIAREAPAAVLVHHPNLVELLGVGSTPAGVPYLVMEAVTGKTLEEFLRETPRLPVDSALVLARQAAAGLCALHRAEIVHGALTPGSLMVLGDVQQPYGLKVLDFGIAKLWRAFRGGDADATRSPSRYRAPEQIVDERVEPRSDVYSLSLILFRMLSGQDSVDSTLDPKSALFGALPRLLELDPGLDPRLDAIVVNATRKRPENRHASMASLLGDLDALVGLSEGHVEIRKLALEPDVYQPQTQRGREFLADRLH